MIAIIGCGTLGSRAAPLLREHELLLIDHDTVKSSNLPVQNFSENEIGKPKATVIAGRCRNAKAHITFLDKTNMKLLEEAQLVIDCTDNLVSRRLISRYCTKQGIALVHGAAAGTTGIAALFIGRPDLEDLYAHKISVETCRSEGIETTTADAVARKQAQLAERYLDGEEKSQAYLIHQTTTEEVKLSEHLIAKREQLQEEFYINYCEQAGCMSAKPIKKQNMKERSGLIGNVEYHLFPSGEIHFLKEEDVDVIQKVSEQIYAENYS